LEPTNANPIPNDVNDMFEFDRVLGRKQTERNVIACDSNEASQQALPVKLVGIVELEINSNSDVSPTLLFNFFSSSLFRLDFRFEHLFARPKHIFFFLTSLFLSQVSLVQLLDFRCRTLERLVSHFRSMSHLTQPYSDHHFLRVASRLLRHRWLAIYFHKEISQLVKHSVCLFSFHFHPIAW
jgi:hypothetical protein